MQRIVLYVPLSPVKLVKLTMLIIKSSLFLSFSLSRARICDDVCYHHWLLYCTVFSDSVWPLEMEKTCTTQASGV